MAKVGRRKGNSKKQTKSNKKSKSVKSSQSKKKRTMKKKSNKIVHKPTYIESLLNQLKKEEPKEQKEIENPLLAPELFIDNTLASGINK